MAKKVSLYGLLTALAFIFSYVERLVPIPLGVPGIKLGLANLVVLIALFTMRVPEAFVIAVARIALSGWLFGNLYSLLYALGGGLLSFAVMAWLSRRSHMSCVGISVAGAVTHNVGQLAVAAAVTKTAALIYYLPALLLAGILAGWAVGLTARLLLSRAKRLLPTAISSRRAEKRS